jgi:hypothetical protein
VPLGVPVERAGFGVLRCVSERGEARVSELAQVLGGRHLDDEPAREDPWNVAGLSCGRRIRWMVALRECV